MDIETMTIGSRTPEVHFTVTNEQIREYAELSFDHNPLHVDEEFAKKSMFKGIIAHGTIPLAYIYDSIFRYLGVSWIEDLVVNVKLIGPVRPNDRITCFATLKSVDDGSITFDVSGIHRNREPFVVGDAVVPRRCLATRS